ncbi:hypothetical protein GF324_11050, partial [bacterium]|nr:hypothetical protein [bacterium]
MRTRFTHPIRKPLDLHAARIALINLLYTRIHEGRCMLRLDDTDSDNNDDSTVLGAWMDDLRKLLSPWIPANQTEPWNEGPLISSTIAGKHRDLARLLMDHGAAYYCFASAGELEAYRQQLAAEGKPERPGRLWRDRSNDEVQRRRQNGDPYV